VERLDGARAAAVVHAAAACKRDVALAAEAAAARAAEEEARAALDKARVAAAAAAAGRGALANEEEAMAAARRCAPIREFLSRPLASSVGLHPNPTLTHPHLFSLATRAPTLTLTQALAPPPLHFRPHRHP